MAYEDLPPPPHGKFGGYMPDPPDDCKWSRLIRFDENGRNYIDNTVCDKCDKNQKCKRHKEFQEEWKEWEKEAKKLINIEAPTIENLKNKAKKEKKGE